MKSSAITVVTLSLFASLLYARSPEYRLLRVCYSICLYLSVLQMIVLYRRKRNEEIALPPYTKPYLFFLGVVCLMLLLKDVTNNKFDFITLINNQNSLVTVVPIFAFGLGYRTVDLTGFFKLLLFASILFILFVIFPHLGAYHYYHGYVCATAIIPFFLLSREYPRYRIYALFLVILACVFSILSDYRIIMLRIGLFFSLFLAFTAFKNFKLVKILILFITCFFLFHVIINFEPILDYVGSLIGVKSFAVDTRTFLYEELFGELRTVELITGRGFLGTYFSDFFFQMQMELLMEEGAFETRFISEVGFLQLILKGGFLFYVLYTIPLLFTSLKGLFQASANSLSFGLSIYILAEFFLTFFENLPAYDFGFVMLFFLSGYTLKTIRQGTPTQEDVSLSYGQPTCNLRR